MAERARAQRIVLVVAGWLGAAVLATGVTLAAVSSIGTGIFGSSAGPLGQDEVARALSTLPTPPGADSATPTTPTTPGTASSSPSTPAPASRTRPDAEPTVITSPGGSVVARCSSGLVELRSWSPAQGFRTEGADRRPTRTAEVEFESEGSEVEIEIRCLDGVPKGTVTVDD